MTVYATLLGFLWALVIGVGLGVVIARVRWLEQTLNPFVVASQVLPKVALVPLFVVWFGFGVTSKVLIAATLAFFPILTNTVLGVKSIDRGHGDVMLSLNATRWQIFRRLELPSALPYIITGMEIGIVLALIGAIVGEYVGGDTGLGSSPGRADECVRDRRPVCRHDPDDHPGIYVLLRHFAAAAHTHSLARNPRAPRPRSSESGYGAAWRSPAIIEVRNRCASWRSRIGRDRLKAGKYFAAFGRVLLAHAGAVGVGLCDDLLQRDRPAAALVKIESRRQRRAGADVAQRRDQFESIMQAAIKAHAAEGLLRCAASPASATPGRENSAPRCAYGHDKAASPAPRSRTARRRSPAGSPGSLPRDLRRRSAGLPADRSTPASGRARAAGKNCRPASSNRRCWTAVRGAARTGRSLSPAASFPDKSRLRSQGRARWRTTERGTVGADHETRAQLRRLARAFEIERDALVVLIIPVASVPNRMSAPGSERAPQAPAGTTSIAHTAPDRDGASRSR